MSPPLLPQDITMTETEETVLDLLPCPFCGCARIYERGFRCFECPECRAEGPTKATKAEAVAAWNTRAALSRAPEVEGLTFEVGCRVQPRGGGAVIGELLEFNTDATGALIRWNDGHEIWKALRNLEVLSPPSMKMLVDAEWLTRHVESDPDVVVEASTGGEGDEFDIGAAIERISRAHSDSYGLNIGHNTKVAIEAELRAGLSHPSPEMGEADSDVSSADRAFVRHLIREMRSAIADDPMNAQVTTGPLDPDILERVLEVALRQPPSDAVYADADRYRFLRNRDAGPAGSTPPGPFIGVVPENLILTEDEADEAVDAAMSKLKENGLSREELGGLARSLPSGDAQERSPAPPLSDGGANPSDGSGA